MGLQIRIPFRICFVEYQVLKNHVTSNSQMNHQLVPLLKNTHPIVTNINVLPT